MSYYNMMENKKLSGMSFNGYAGLTGIIRQIHFEETIGTIKE